MAHSTQISEETTFIHNGDLTGEVTIVTKSGQLNVESEDLINFVVDHLRNLKIDQLEMMDYDELKQKIIINL